jgi:hypothetical protein
MKKVSIKNSQYFILFLAIITFAIIKHTSKPLHLTKIHQPSAINNPIHSPIPSNSETQRGIASNASASKIWIQEAQESHDTLLTNPLNEPPAGIPKETKKLELASSSRMGCFTVHYNHKKLASHPDAETCFEHENEITLRTQESADLPKGVNFKSICTYIDGKVVPFRLTSKNADHVVIGAIAGPQSKIAVRFCLGKTLCSQICTPIKDTFLSALGADDTTTDPKDGWDDSEADSKDQAQLSAEVQALDRDQDQLTQKVLVFKDWIFESASPSCENISTDSEGANE